MTANNPYYNRIIKFLASRRFFLVILTFFVLQAVWIALSGVYPMAFDENFHLGIIQLYAHHLSPFWSSQPAGADAFGAVARDPSYFYQYLMSFPYRIISLFTHDQTIIVIWLRFIDIALFSWGLFLFRRLLLKVNVRPIITNCCLLLFVLLPIVPLLAAQINYDDLVMPLVALSLLLALKYEQGLSENRFDIKVFLQLLIVCLLSSIVKYAFLPIFVAIVIFIVWRSWQHKTVLNNWRQVWQKLSLTIKSGLLIALVIAAGLFGERYGINVVRYHTPIPDCGQVLTVEQCSQYGPWSRDYHLSSANTNGPHSPIIFTGDWFYGMWLRTFFAVAGPSINFETHGPLILPGIGAIVFGSIGILSLIVTFKKLLKRYQQPAVWLLVGTAACYILALWLDEYRAYIKTGQPVAINGRYILPVLLPLMALMATGFIYLVRKYRSIKLYVPLACFICLLWGGGTLTFILRSGNGWYWPNSTVTSINQNTQKVLGPVVPGYRNVHEFLH